MPTELRGTVKNSYKNVFVLWGSELIDLSVYYRAQMVVTLTGFLPALGIVDFFWINLFSETALPSLGTF